MFSRLSQDENRTTRCCRYEQTASNVSLLSLLCIVRYDRAAGIVVVSQPDAVCTQVIERRLCHSCLTVADIASSSSSSSSLLQAYCRDFTKEANSSILRDPSPLRSAAWSTAKHSCALLLLVVSRCSCPTTTTTADTTSHHDTAVLRRGDERRCIILEGEDSIRLCRFSRSLVPRVSGGNLICMCFYNMI